MYILLYIAIYIAIDIAVQQCSLIETCFVERRSLPISDHTTACKLDCITIDNPFHPPQSRRRLVMDIHWNI